jgi:hypothetical protein
MTFFSPFTAVDKSAMKMSIYNNPATCLVTKEIKCNEYLQGDQESSIAPHPIQHHLLISLSIFLPIIPHEGA